MSTRGLRLIGWSLDRKPVPSSITGLPQEDRTVIGYGGKGPKGKDLWHLSWYRNEVRKPTPDRLFDSPEEAVAAIEEILKTVGMNY